MPGSARRCRRRCPRRVRRRCAASTGRRPSHRFERQLGPVNAAVRAAHHAAASAADRQVHQQIGAQRRRGRNLFDHNGFGFVGGQDVLGPARQRCSQGHLREQPRHPPARRGKRGHGILARRPNFTSSARSSSARCSALVTAATSAYQRAVVSSAAARDAALAWASQACCSGRSRGPEPTMLCRSRHSANRHGRSHVGGHRRRQHVEDLIRAPPGFQALADLASEHPPQVLREPRQRLRQAPQHLAEILDGDIHPNRSRACGLRFGAGGRGVMSLVFIRKRLGKGDGIGVGVAAVVDDYAPGTVPFEHPDVTRRNGRGSR